MNIEELKRLAEAATPGPWYAHQEVCRVGEVCSVNQGGQPWFEIYSDDFHKSNNASDAAYIAAANPAAVLELIRQLEHYKADSEANRHLLTESRADERCAMGWIASCRQAVGDDGSIDMPGFVEYLMMIKQQRDELLAALKEARELVEDWGAYAPAYMQEKHDLEGDMNKLDAAIASAEAP